MSRPAAAAAAASDAAAAAAAAPGAPSDDGQWIFTLAELSQTPSAVDGMPVERERENRGKGVHFISQVGIMLKLPQLTLSTAAVFLQRFFMRHSMVDKAGRAGFHYYAIGATALFLATKVEEHSRKLKELIIACCRVAQKNANLVVDEQSKEYWRWRDTILHHEDLLLEAICFDLTYDPPYTIFFDFLTRLGAQHDRRLRDTAWTFLNDSSLTMLCLLAPSRTLAAAAVYCAARHHGVVFADRDGRAWWDQLAIALPDIRRACNYMASVYEHHPLRASEPMYTSTPEDGDPSVAKTRAPPPLRPSPTPSLPFDHDDDRVPAPAPARARSPSKRPRDRHAAETSARSPTADPPDDGGRKRPKVGHPPSSHGSSALGQQPTATATAALASSGARTNGAPDLADGHELSEEGEVEA
ncbi:MAG: Cyclin- protein fam58a [Phylliscum demangeonii]|nr:MAG: Cyclin- protein fam58a [Phylliscum demangeonii]